jgi:hypothetical protein
MAGGGQDQRWGGGNRSSPSGESGQFLQNPARSNPIQARNSGAPILLPLTNRPALQEMKNPSPKLLGSRNTSAYESTRCLTLPLLPLPANRSLDQE